MKCNKCNSEKIQVVSEMIQTDEKDGQGLYAFLYFISITALIVSFLFFIAGVDKTNENTFWQISEIITASKIFAFAFPTLVFTMLFKRLVPFKFQTKTKVVCLDCGHTWYLQEEQKSDAEDDEE